jgi:hypothetical protein
MFSTNKGRSSGRFISFKGSGTLISKNDNPVVLELGCGRRVFCWSSRKIS